MVEQTGGQSIEVALAETLRDGDLGPLGIDMAEVALDTFMSDGIWRNIPMIGTALGLIKTGLSVRDYLLVKNIVRFLSEAKTIDRQTRHDMVQRLDTDPKFGARVGELLIGLLDRNDDARKPALHGRAFAMYCRRELAADRLRRLHVVIDAVHLPEVDRLRLVDMSVLSADVDPLQEFDPFTERNLTQAGILISADRTVVNSRPAVTYEGIVLLKLMGRLTEGPISPVW